MKSSTIGQLSSNPYNLIQNHFPFKLFKYVQLFSYFIIGYGQLLFMKVVIIAGQNLYYVEVNVLCTDGQMVGIHVIWSITFLDFINDLNLDILSFFSFLLCMKMQKEYMNLEWLSIYIEDCFSSYYMLQGYFVEINYRSKVVQV